jgi:hypothetical protein
MTNQVAGAHPGARSPERITAGHVVGAHAVTSPALRAAEPPRRSQARTLQLALGFVWLLDAILQFQAFMFGRGFSSMLQQTAAGNPAVIADPINWSARLIAQHDVAANAAFAAIQLAIGLGIAWRPTLRIALGLSIAWSVAVWWLGEGLGGLLTGTASPVNGAPGAVLLYALLAVLLWPPLGPRQRDHGTDAVATPVIAAPFVAATAVGSRIAKLLWLVLWGGLAWLAVLPATAAPRALAGMVTEVSAGQPAWLAGTDGRLAAFLSHHGPGTAIVLAVVLAVIAVGIYLPPSVVRILLVLAVATAAALWLAQGLGGMLTGSGTDPESAPVLALLAVAYWPRQESPA